MKTNYIPLVIESCSEILQAVIQVQQLDTEDERIPNRLLTSFGEFQAIQDAMLTTLENAQVEASRVIAADTLITSGPEGHENKCKDHDWVSADNSIISGLEICRTCLEAGEENVPIRPKAKIHE